MSNTRISGSNVTTAQFKRFITLTLSKLRHRVAGRSWSTKSKTQVIRIYRS